MFTRLTLVSFIAFLHVFQQIFTTKMQRKSLLVNDQKLIMQLTKRVHTVGVWVRTYQVTTNLVTTCTVQILVFLKFFFKVAINCIAKKTENCCLCTLARLSSFDVTMPCACSDIIPILYWSLFVIHILFQQQRATFSRRSGLPMCAVKSLEWVLGRDWNGGCGGGSCYPPATVDAS